MSAMTHHRMLVGASLFSVLLLSLHFAQDAFHARPGTIDAGAGNLTTILITALALSGPLLVPERRSGRLIMLLGALGAIGMPVLHFLGPGNRSRYPDALLFIWCLIALGVNGLISLMLWVTEFARLRAERRASR